MHYDGVADYKMPETLCEVLADEEIDKNTKAQKWSNQEQIV